MNWKLGSNSGAAGRVPLFLVLTLSLAAANARIQGQTIEELVNPKEPLEYDYCGNLVPMTLSHMYRGKFNQFNLLDKAGKKLGSERDPGKSFLLGFRHRLGLSEADFAIFGDSAIRWGAKDEAFNKQMAAIGIADRARHPDTPALSESARRARRAIIRDREKALSEEVDVLHARLAPDHAKALDEHTVEESRKGNFVPSKAPRASSPCVMPNP